MQEKARWNEGWILVLYAFIAVGSLFLWLGVLRGDDESLQLFLRITGRTSTVIFCFAFAASALHRLMKNGFTAWLLRNRRYVGVSFATCHTFHLIGIILIARRDVVGFSVESGAVTIIGGGFGFLLMFAMVATSFDNTARWLGPRKWKILHTIGGYYLWGIFAYDYVGLGLESWVFLPLTILVLSVPVLKLLSRRTEGVVLTRPG